MPVQRNVWGDMYNVCQRLRMPTQLIRDTMYYLYKHIRSLQASVLHFCCTNPDQHLERRRIWIWILIRKAGFVTVVYHVTVVASAHGFLKKFLPLVIICVLRTAGSSYWALKLTSHGKAYFIYILFEPK